MKVKIAIIGSTDFCGRTEQLVINRNDIELDWYRYNEPQEAPHLIRTLKPCDAILFSGSLPYTYAKKAIENFPIPTLYLKQDETAVAITLLHLAAQKQLDLNRISIDIREKVHIDHVINDLNQIIELPFIHVLQDDEVIQDISSFHEQLSLLSKTDMAITSVHAVYEQLKQQNIPTIKMIDPESSIVQSIELAKQQAILQKSNSAQIAVGVIQVREHNQNIESVVEQLATLMQARWSEQQGEYTLFTTMGNIEYSIKNHEFLTLYQTLDSQAKLAFGCGETIVDATENAQFALEFIKKTDDHSFYVLDSNKKLHGPFPQSHSTIEMKIHEPALVEMAVKTKLSPSNISKLMTFSKSRQSKQFTANDLALHLNVTRRTAERILKRLVEFNYAKIIGEEMTYRQGRPRALYEFNFPTYT
ncbi:transcriptional regulator [Sporosarcina limicola]|uniref:Transcriptional regulator n=1 Tax=Sporosarcina limicola TaxID=34101 RepID=A0A927MJ22_9BACL|nr:transcriptional regulator [Sporosarcina limicola]MBE1555590.1 putative transcriptional regulator [Sporosarcina limicola]